MKEKIEKVNRAMEQEGYKLTRSEKETLEEVASGNLTADEGRQEIKSALEKIKESLKGTKENERKISKK